MRTLLLISLLAVFAIKLNGQDLNDLLSKYTQENGMKYLQPLADVAGVDVNSGLFHDALIKKTGFQLYVGLVMPTALIGNKQKYFTAFPEGFFEPKNPVEAPSVFGPSENMVVDGVGGTQYVFPGGLNMDYFPVPMPQLTLGSVYGTDVTFRFMTSSTSDELGRINLLGFGLRHSISQYIPDFPVELAAGVYNQYLKLGTIADLQTWLFNVQGSYRLSILTFYGALGFERSTLDIEYTYKSDGEESTIAFDLDGSNSVRFTGGITFNMGPVKLNIDYNLAKQSALSAGLGVSFGDKIVENK